MNWLFVEELRCLGARPAAACKSTTRRLRICRRRCLVRVLLTVARVPCLIPQGKDTFFAPGACSTQATVKAKEVFRFQATVNSMEVFRFQATVNAIEVSRFQATSEPQDRITCSQEMALLDVACTVSFCPLSRRVRRARSINITRTTRGYVRCWFCPTPTLTREEREASTSCQVGLSAFPLRSLGQPNHLGPPPFLGL